MILGVSIREDRVFVTAQGGDELRFFQFDILPEEIDGNDNIWDWADDDLRKIYDEAEMIVLGIPSSLCLAKRIELDNRLDKEKNDYRSWRAGLELPGEPGNFIYGFIPVSKRFDSEKTETLFYAAARDKIEKIRSSVFTGRSPECCVIIPEQLALTEVLRKSISKDDILQAAIINIEPDNAVAVILNDNRYFHSRSFGIPRIDKDELGVDIETYLLSKMSDDEQLPLVVVGDTGQLRLNWSPVAPVFLSINNLDHTISWGLSEFVAAGG